MDLSKSESLSCSLIPQNSSLSSFRISAQLYLINSRYRILIRDHVQEFQNAHDPDVQLKEREKDHLSAKTVSRGIFPEKYHPLTDP